jgi:hypothetical protein
MSESEEELLREEVINLFQTLALTADVIEAAERQLGPSNWDIERGGQRAARAVGDTELDADEMREVIKDMREDLEKALEPLRRFRQEENATKAKILLGFMLNGSIQRIEKVLS